MGIIVLGSEIIAALLLSTDSDKIAVDVKKRRRPIKVYVRRLSRRR